MSEIKGQGLRLNSDKVRHDLLEPYAIEELAKVFTAGAKKYEDHNWLKGMNWSTMLASLKRHISAFEQGEDMDFDPHCEKCQEGTCVSHTGLYHMAHAAWNCMALVSYYKHFPEGDDRLHGYLKHRKIGLDIDGVLADFNGAINEKIGNPDYEPIDWADPLTIREFNKVKAIPEFWANLKPLCGAADIPFEAHCYITARSVDIEVTRKWLHNNGFPDVPVYSVGTGESKIEVAKKAGIDFFIDDYYNNFVELNKAGICTFLYDRPWNRKFNVGHKRVKNFKDFKNRFL